MKKLFFKIITFVLIISAVFAFVACNENTDDNKDNTPVDHSNAPTSKVILFIGDGMGPNHVDNTELFYGESMYFSGFTTKTKVDTNSLSGLTDSAAAATAMATGQRVKNEIIALDGKNPIVSITELAKADRYGAGVVTSDEITGATPSGFSAHAKSRSNSAEILLSQKDAQLDLLLGAGSYSSVYSGLFAEKGWTWAEKYSDLGLDNKRYVAAFNDVNYENGTDEIPTLTQLATYAIDYMEKNHPEGYFLMIEGAKIDKRSHSNDVYGMMKNMLDFNSAIKAVDQKLSSLGDDYSIIVTADHETGGIKKANTKEEVNNDLYTTTNHTATNVNLYFKSTLTTIPEQINKELILNTDIFLLCKYLLAIA